MTKKDDLLEEFYEDFIRAKSKGLPPFNEADPETILNVEKSITFAGWRLKKALASCAEAFKKFTDSCTIIKNKHKSKYHD